MVLFGSSFVCLCANRWWRTPGSCDCQGSFGPATTGANHTEDGTPRGLNGNDCRSSRLFDLSIVQSINKGAASTTTNSSCGFIPHVDILAHSRRSRPLSSLGSLIRSREHQYPSIYMFIWLIVRMVYSTLFPIDHHQHHSSNGISHKSRHSPSAWISPCAVVAQIPIHASNSKNNNPPIKS